MLKIQLPGWMKKHFTKAFPTSVNFRGQTYYATGKVGNRIRDNVRSAEYEADDESRVWVGADGKITPE